MSSRYFAFKVHIIPGQYIREYPGATLDSQEDVLKLHIKQYTPLEHMESQQKGMTIIGGHANGFPKELYEPLWDELYLQAKASGVSVKSIWMADVAHQGHSYILNEDKLASDPSWNDPPRDLLCMINHFRAEMPRPIVGIGHSMGGSILINLSIMHPRLLTTLVLVDPVFQLTPLADGSQGSSNYAQLSAFRRDVWPSRSLAAESFNRSPFYRTWDPRVLALWNEFALRALPTAIYPEIPTSQSGVNGSQTRSAGITEKPVTLTTPKHQEVFMFGRPNFPIPGQPIMNRTTHPDLDPSLPAKDQYPFYRPEAASTFRAVPRLRPGALYIFGGSSEVSPPEFRKDKMEITGIGVGGSGGVKEGRVKSVTLEGIGHLIPMIVPKICAEKAMEWLVPELRKWEEEEDRWTETWKSTGKQERRVLSEEYKKKLGGDPKGKTSLEKL